MKNLKTLIALTLGIPAIASYAQNEVPVSEMNLDHAYQIYGSPMKNMAVTGTPLKVNGKNYTHGVGVLSQSILKIRLDGKADCFRCLVGVNDRSVDYSANDISMVPLTDGTMIYYRTQGDEKQFAGVGDGNRNIGKGSVVFRVSGDGKELFRSGRISAGMNPEEVSVDLKGVKILELEVLDGGDGVSGDHADWLDALISYSGSKPETVLHDFKGIVPKMSAAIKSRLENKIVEFPSISLTFDKEERDWLIDSKPFKTEVYQSENKDIILTNGLVSRVFRIFPNLATIDVQNRMTGDNMLRAVSNEGMLTIDGKTYPLGGLDGQKDFGYTQYKWIDEMTAVPNSFQVTDFYVSPASPRMKWANRRWSLVREWNLKGKELTFVMRGPGVLNDVFVKLHYVVYDGIPVMSKWLEVENHSGVAVNLDEFVLEQLAMAEPESPVELCDADKFRKPNIHVESDWGFHGFIEKETDKTEHWMTDPRYTSQCNYPLLTPCLLEVKLPMGPDERIEPNACFKSFRTWIMPFDSEDRDRKGLFVKRMYKTIAPWTTENPIFMHCTSSDPKIVKQAIDQCAETGYEMVILSFGSGLNIEDESQENVQKFRELKDYASSKGIELGGYSLLSSRWISEEVDVINPKTGKRGGMIFGSSPCLSSEWGYDYFRKVRQFFEKTGMSAFENDGSYPGNVCASAVHAHHKGLKDSQWKQRKQIAGLYEWMCENGIYTNIPDYGYMLNGGTKVGIGYREVNWSLPRERQLVLGRQVMFDGLWERLPSMCWTFVPLTQYHGGGAAATLEPLNDHLDDYKAHMFQNYGSGVQACYRGHRLYDTNKTKKTVKEVVAWYKKYRDILNSDVMHLRRPDGKDWDGIMHVNPELKEKGLVLLYNPTDDVIEKTIDIPLYYTGIENKAIIREKESEPKAYYLDRKYNVSLKVSIPARGYTWYVIEHD